MHSSPTTPPLFREVQQFRNPWLWGILLCSSGVSVVVLAWISYQQLWRGQVIGTSPLANWVLLGLTVATCISAVLGIVLFYRMKLIVEIHRDRLWIYFFPLQLWLFPTAQRTILLSDIRDYQACTYRPLRDYGGWGIRRGWRDRAYTVSGNRGVQITLQTSEALLIGSQRSEELVDTLAIAQSQLR